jgi:hypothetical protein
VNSDSTSHGAWRAIFAAATLMRTFSTVSIEIENFSHFLGVDLTFKEMYLV